MSQKHFFLNIITVFLLSFIVIGKGYSQVTITGPTCVVAGGTYNYSISGTYNSSTTMTWCVFSSGTILQAYGTNITSPTTDCRSGTYVQNIVVRWNTPGSGQVSLTSSSGTAPNLNFTVSNALTPGSVNTNKTQTITYNTVPGDINCSVAAYGSCSPAYTYQWQSSTDQTTWTNLSGQASANTSFSTVLLTTTYYRRQVTETNSNTIDYSDIATVFVNAAFSSTFLEPISQSEFVGGGVAQITGDAATNCSGSITYQWQQSTDGGATYLPASGVNNSLNYTPPSIVTTFYRRMDLCNPTGLVAYSINVSKQYVYAHVAAGIVSPSSKSITYNTDPGYFSTTSLTGGFCAPVYTSTWQKSTDNINWTDVSIYSTYDPGILTVSTYIRQKVVCSPETVYSNTIIITVNPQIFPGTIFPAAIGIQSGTGSGPIVVAPATGGACSGSFSYQWQQSTDVNFYTSTTTDISGATGLNYTPGNLTTTTYYRRMVTCGSDIVYSNVLTITVNTGTSLYNYVRSRVISKPGITDEATAAALTSTADVKQTTHYLDGLGRLIQTVAMQQTPLGKDMVALNAYDEFGRETIKYLPFVSAGAGGTFRTDALTEQNTFNATQFPDEQYFYGRTDYEPSPLNIINAAYAPGNNWVGAGRNVQSKMWSNTATDGVKIWTVTDVASNFGAYASSALYDAGELYKSVTIDENGKQVVEFKDNEGKVILKKVQLTATADNGTGSDYSGWLCTYYIYDIYNNLRCVIQPRGVELLILNGWNLNALSGDILNEQCFRYEYDYRNRMTRKQVPGSGDVYLVYDKRDRLVFTQDAKLRLQNQWLYSLYDDLNRPVQTGMMVYTGTWAALIASVDGSMNTTAATGITGSNVEGTITILTLPQREPGVTSYTATTEIDFLPGFTSEDNASFIAQIIDASPSTFAGSQILNTNPVPSEATLIALTYSFYDSYSWTTKTYNTTDNNKVDAGTNPYAETLPSANSNLVRGQLTGTRVRVIEDANNLSTGKWMEAVSFFDDKTRSIQSHSVNVTGGLDVTTLLYDFSGKILSSYINHQKLGGAVKTFSVAGRNTYDNGGRLTKTEKKLNNTGTWESISDLTYDEQGQLKTKKLGTDPVITSNPLETLTYDYNIRGWLLGINRDYAKTVNSTSNYFGFDLGYDKTDIKPAGGSSIGAFDAAAYNGNISGMLWKSTGDDQVRKYDFTYDAVNRLASADFKQYSTTNSIFDLSDGIDFTVSNLSYDANGNIKTQKQNGWKIGGSTTIDDLSYNYLHNNSNKLQNVIDGSNDVNTLLGDFRYSSSYNTVLGGTKPATATDYTYDGNGNLSADKNKDITGIAYNYMNLPSVVTITAKGSIEYIYDAAGNKLKKIVHETGKTDKTTLYLFGTYQDDILQFLPQEEGRIRYKVGDGSFAYDYFIKDHLGNVRMVLTEEQQTDMYPAATMEEAQTTTEESLYANLNTTRLDKPLSYPVDNTTNPNAKVAKVSGATGSQKVGPSIILKVMAGDKFNIKVSSWYKTNGVIPGTPVPLLADLLTALVNGVGGYTYAHGGVTTAQLQSSGVLTPGATQFLNNQAPDALRPKAYLNWILLDEQFKFVSSSSGAEQVPVETTFGTAPNQIVYQHVKSNLPIDKNGYLYVYVSNETPNIDVFFDNLQVTHMKGPLLEETHYYPFGLTMAGISSKAAGGLENKKKYNGIEFDEDLDIDSYEAYYRNLDPQTGRWWQIDPKVDEGQESMSPYATMADDPVLSNDPLGDVATESQSSSEAAGICCVGAAELWEETEQAAASDGPAGEVVLVGGAVASAFYALWEVVSESPVAPGNVSMTGIPSSNQLQTHLQYLQDKAQVAPPKPVAQAPTKIAAPNVVQAKAKKVPKDLVGEAKAAQQKAAEATARAANRQAQTAAGKTKIGKSNQGTRGSHNSGGNKSGKHDKAEARRAREQKAADTKKEQEKSGGT
jgi:RHS repeat-associated protein